ncbi:carbon-nitrogen hydrolase family protein [Paenibacillus beijingensis]|uniref:CN hydrolase domain-containing protein n=1 Tax=Paenibacillus beijingensis TaxID=1126833 RepID=A0A0D5NQR5_9BACL|nr:carbon-nitrogen hydrolase family protein [Paenibacillus beijingensis]AJY77629.1 hypothetical protein VN24_09585 [Paenibacillus beijingensis]
MTELKIAIAQTDSKIMDKEHNVQKAEQILDRIGGEADVVCFPELFTTGYNFDIIGDAYYELAETIPGPTVERLTAKAKQYGIAVLGTIVEKDGEQEGVLYDTTFVINEKGEYSGKYRKAHLYPTEHRYFRSGSDFPVFDICGVKAGVAICYDHGFGEMFRIMALKGAQVIFIPSAIPKNFEYLLDLRTRARAQDNQLFTVAVNRVGAEDDVVYCGNSKIVNPRGEVIHQAGDGEEVLIGTIDLSEITQERKQEMILRSRRPELYGKLMKA